MVPIEFPQQTCVYAKDQPEYLPLPAHRTNDGIVTSCWCLTWRERLRILFGGRLWISVMTFNRSPQPILPSATLPEFVNEAELCRET